MAKSKKTQFAFDWTRLEQFAKDKTELPMPQAIQIAGTAPPTYYHSRRTYTDSVPMIKSILAICEELGLTLQEFRSLFIEIK